MDQRAIRRARDQFFDSGAVSPLIRPEIVKSWRRSALVGLNPESRIKPAFMPVPASSGALLRSAVPVVRRLLDDVGDGCAAMLLIDRDGIVVGRWSNALGISSLLDASEVVPGRAFDETLAGTTGLGTPLEDARSAIVDGAEHVLTGLDGLTAVGTPIWHPTRRSIEGVIDIVGMVGVDTTMMLPLIAAAAREIGERLIAGYAAEDRQLMDAFLSSERRGPRRPVLAINNRIIIGNAPGNALNLSPHHESLWSHVVAAVAIESTIVQTGPPDARQTGHIEAVWDGEKLVGALLKMERNNKTRSQPTSVAPARRSAFDESERELIMQALAGAGGNRSAAAAALGVSRATLYRKMERLRIRE